MSPKIATQILLSLSGQTYNYTTLSKHLGMSRTAVKAKVEAYTTKEQRINAQETGKPIDVFAFFFWTASDCASPVTWIGKRPTHGSIYMIEGKPYTTREAVNDLSIPQWKLHDKYYDRKVA